MSTTKIINQNSKLIKTAFHSKIKHAFEIVLRFNSQTIKSKWNVIELFTSENRNTESDSLPKVLPKLLLKFMD